MQKPSMPSPVPPLGAGSRLALRAGIAAILLLLAAALAYMALSLGPRGPVSSGTALVGGSFSMTNQNGEAVTEKTFAGKPMLLFFGYTYCPDVCPTELQVMMQALDELGPKAADVQPIFVSIDPARDTPAVLKDYVSGFGQRLQALTGTPEQVAAIASAYRVFYEKQPNTKDPAAYLMDHSSIIYLMDADGKFLKHFSYSTDAKALGAGILEALGR